MDTDFKLEVNAIFIDPKSKMADVNLKIYKGARQTGENLTREEARAYDAWSRQHVTGFAAPVERYENGWKLADQESRRNEYDLRQLERFLVKFDLGIDQVLNVILGAVNLNLDIQEEPDAEDLPPVPLVA